MTPAERAKQAYQTGGSGRGDLLSSSQPTRRIRQTESWPIHSADGDLVGFIELESGAKLPTELIIQDRTYQLTDGHIGRPTEDRS